MSSLQNPPIPTPQVTTGQYTGNSTVNRAIPHGLPIAPKSIDLWQHVNVLLYHIINQVNTIRHVGTGEQAVAAPTATNFYVGNATSYAESGNLNAVVYDWIAIG